MSEKKKNGRIEYYYEDGQISAAGNYKNGEKDGKWEEYYETGEIKYSGNYIDGEKDTSFERYYDNGKLLGIENYFDVIARRTQFCLDKYKEQCHIVDGLIIVKNHSDGTDGMIKAIRSSDSRANAGLSLQKLFNIDKIQANGILNLTLKDVFLINDVDFESEKKDLLEKIKWLDNVLEKNEKKDANYYETIDNAVKKYKYRRKSKKDGKQEYYFENGEIKATGDYKDGVGKLEVYDEDGNIKRILKLKDDGELIEVLQ